MKQVIDLLPQHSQVCLVVKQAFSQAFCMQIIQEKKHSFSKAITHYPTSYRNNDRQVIDDQALSDFLFKEISQYIPAKIATQGIGKDETGKWRLKKLNTRLRVCRYRPRQYFNKHLDGVHYESDKVQSKLTFMVYLNSHQAFKGGRTLFFPSKESEEIIQTFLPETGDLIIFDHNLWHSGEELQAGVKYILRSDILYERVSPGKPLAQQAFKEGHLGYIWAITKFKDFVITGGRDKLLKLWDAQGQLLIQHKAHEHSVLALLNLQDQYLITASRDQKLKCWAVTTDNNGIRLVEKWHNSCHQATILCLCLINQQTFASSGGDGKVFIINQHNELIQQWQAHQEWIWAMVKVNDQYLFTAGEDGQLKWWNFKQKSLEGKWAVNSSPINSLVFNPHTQQIFTGRNNGQIECLQWDKQTQSVQLLYTVAAHRGIVRCLKIHPPYLISGAEDNEVKIWHLSGSRPISWHHTFGHDNFVQDVLAYAQTLISISYDGKISPWQIPD